MSILREIQDSGQRFQQQIAKLKSLLKSKNVRSIPELKRAIKADPEFKSKWNEIWKEIAEKDGGKLSLATVGLILGSIMGGVGIAALGGAIGLPLALVLGLGGLLGGTEADLIRKENRKISIPKDLYEHLQLKAAQQGVTVDQYSSGILFEVTRDKS